ncbi:hypothetical protein I0E51_11115 [Pseudomonas lalucatii]|nr:hypothetical protein [Pseudomonas lalucatii]
MTQKEGAMATRGRALLLAALLALSGGHVTASEVSADRLQALRSESWRVLSAVLLDYDALAGQLALEQRERQLASLEVMTSLMRAPSLAPLAGKFAAFADALQALVRGGQGFAAGHQSFARGPGSAGGRRRTVL